MVYCDGLCGLGEIVGVYLFGVECECVVEVLFELVFVEYVGEFFGGW